MVMMWAHSCQPWLNRAPVDRVTGDVLTQLNIGTGANGSFSIAANAAFNMTLDPPFTPYANNLFFIHGAFIFEDVGVTAYQVRACGSVLFLFCSWAMPDSILVLLGGLALRQVGRCTYATSFSLATRPQYHVPTVRPSSCSALCRLVTAPRQHKARG